VPTNIPICDPLLLEIVAYAQKSGQAREIYKRIDEELHNAERRKGSPSLSYDINPLHLMITRSGLGVSFG
jgi:hypothetical protein